MNIDTGYHDGGGDVSAVEEYRAMAPGFAEVESPAAYIMNLADAALAELEAHAEHDEDNLAGLEHALVRANQQYARAEADRDALRHGYEILATKLSEANAELVRLETQPRSD